MLPGPSLSLGFQSCLNYIFQLEKQGIKRVKLTEKKVFSCGYKFQK